MTSRIRPTVSPRRRTHWENEERQQYLVTLAFVGLIALALVFLGGALALGYYDAHLKSVASVNGVGINKDQVIERGRVLLTRIDRDSARVRERLAAGRIDPETADSQLQELAQAEQAVGGQALEDLIDDTLQGQLAPQQGVQVTDADITAALEEESRKPEERKVQGIVVAPETDEDDPGAEPTDAQKQAAQTRAEEALREIQAGTAWWEVSREYSTDEATKDDGEFGYVTREDGLDEAWLEALFALPKDGTTGVVEGEDGSFRIGRVTDIVAAAADPTFQERVEQGPGMGAFRGFARGEVTEDRLRERITAQATEGDVEQVHAARIEIGLPSDPDDPATKEGAVKTRHILYSPNRDPGGAGDVKDDDPAWLEAKKKADAAAATLRGIADVAQREERLGEIAEKESDDTSSAVKGGQNPWFYRGDLDKAFGDAIFVGEHTNGEIIGPVKSAFGYHVILWQAKRPPAEEFAKQLVEQARGGADFAQLARLHSEGEDAEDGGDMGWVARYQLEKEVEDIIFGLQAGQVSDARELTSDTGQPLLVIHKALERQKRPLDPETRRTVERTAFDNWYADQKQKAEDEDRLWREGDTEETTTES